MRANADFIQTYIFPGGMLIDEPRFAAIAGAQRPQLGGPRSATVCIMPRRCASGGSASTLRLQRGGLGGFGDEFHRLWRYYLMYCEGGFRGGGIDVAQVTMVKS